MLKLMKNSRPSVVSTFASPHEPTLKPKACKRASAFPTQGTAFQVGFRLLTLKNKINLYVADRLVQIDNDKKIRLN